MSALAAMAAVTAEQWTTYKQRAGEDRTTIRLLATVTHTHLPGRQVCLVRPLSLPQHSAALQ